MTSATATINAERRNYTILKASYADINGDQANDVVLPAGFGDCILDWVNIEITQIATMMTSPELNGVTIQIVDGSLVDIRDAIGIEPWKRQGALALGNFIQSNFTSALWRANERLYMVFTEVDTNASPTADLTVVMRVRRQRVSP